MMSEKTYVSPSLIGLDTKQAELEALQVVREGGTFQYKELADEDDRIGAKLKLMLRSSGRSSQSYFAGADDVRSGNDYNNERISNAYMLNEENDIGRNNNRGYNYGNVYQYQQQPSLAEGLLQAHKGPYNVLTKNNNVTGKNHPFVAEYNFTRRFPVDFRGCFICGETTHFTRQECKRGFRDPNDRKQYFTEMWAHKPYTKKKLRDGSPNVVSPTPHQTSAAHRINLNPSDVGQYQKDSNLPPRGHVDRYQGGTSMQP